MADDSSGTKPSSLAELIPVAYEELRRLARHRVACLAPGGSIAPTDLVHEVLLRLLEQNPREYQGTDHLIRIAAQAMHNVLVDAARRRVAAKRGGPGKQSRQVAFDDLEVPFAAPAEDMLCFHEACEQVRSHSQEHYDLLLLRVYAGLSASEIALQRGQSTRTVERQWRFVRALMRTQMSRDGTVPPLWR